MNAKNDPGAVARATASAKLSTAAKARGGNLSQEQSPPQPEVGVAQPEPARVEHGESEKGVRLRDPDAKEKAHLLKGTAN